MRPITETERRDWMYGSGDCHQTISHLATSGALECDDCHKRPSVCIGHKGEGTRPTVRCVDCFRADVARERANRPSREELIARVNASIVEG